MRTGLVRSLVTDLFVRVMDQRELADKALHRTLRAHKELHSTERRHVGEALYAMVRLRERLVALVSAGLARVKGLKYDDFATPDRLKLLYAAALVDDLKLTPVEAMQHADLDARLLPVFESVAHGTATWPVDPVQGLARRRSLPLWLAQKFHDQYGAEAEPLAQALNVRAPLMLRANILKATREEVLASLKSEKVDAAPGALCPWTLIVDGRPNMFGLDTYKKGYFEVQDEGSQLIALASGAAPGALVVDACAGGGGKALALAAMMKNSGRVVACDIDEGRLEDVRPRARTAGAHNVETKVVPDSADPVSTLKLGKRADLVLVDAPCSGTGALRRHADARWKMTETEAMRFPALQQRILTRFAPLVKGGGRLLYATCSLLREENQAVVAAFLSSVKGFKLEPMQGLPGAVVDADGFLRTLPHRHGTDGFFAAMLRRE